MAKVEFSAQFQPHDTSRLGLSADASSSEVNQEIPLVEQLENATALLGQKLSCDRVFIYVRSPESAIGRVPFCWRRASTIPNVYDAEWKPEPPELGEEDPMFAAALSAAPPIFVADVETADPATLNREFERQTFGHRALVHAHLCVHQTLWGVLQPCVFDHPREWSEGDRQLVHEAVDWLTPLVVAYVQRHVPNHL